MSKVNNQDGCYASESVHPDCVPDTPPGGNAGDDCITSWKDKKDAANKTLKEAIAEVQMRSEALKYATEWEARLKTCYDNIYKTAEVADKVAREIDGFKAQVGRVCTNAECTVTALELLYCQTREIFEPCIRELVDMMDHVKDCLKCITDPALVRDKGILKVLTEYDQKLREIEALQFDTLKKIVAALKCANILYYSICSGGKDQDYSCDALMDELGQLHCNFDNTANNPDDPVVSVPLDCKRVVEVCDPPSTSSVLISSLVPVPVFPLKTDPYFSNTETQYTNAQTEKEAAKGCLDKAKKEKEAAQACYDSLVAAIVMSENAKAGK